MIELLQQLYALYLEEDYLTALGLIREDITECLNNDPGVSPHLAHFVGQIIDGCEIEDWDEVLRLVGTTEDVLASLN